MGKLLKACVVLTAFAAFYVMPSVVPASPELTDPPGTTAPVGSLVEANNVAHAKTPTTLVYTSTLGNIECTTATLTGTLIKNSGTVIEIEWTTVDINGTAGVTPHTNHCSGPGGFGTITVTPSHAINPSHNGIASLPWCFKSEGLKDDFTMRGGKCSEASRPLTFTFHSSNLGTCSYQRASMTGTYTTAPSEAIVTFQNQEITRVTGSGFCPASLGFDVALTYKTDGTNTPFTIS